MRMFKRIFAAEFLLLPIYIFKLLELFVLKNDKTWVATFVRILLSFMMLPFVTLLILLLAIYYHTIEIILRIKLGREFHNMLDGCDRIWLLKSPSKHVINALYTIADDNNPNQPAELSRFFKTKFELIAKTHPQFSSTIKTYLGIEYFHIIKLNFDHCIKYMDDYNSLEEFHSLLEVYCNKELPEGDTYLWEYYIGRNQIQWHNGKMYPLFVRYHHSLGDGVSLITLMTTHLLENGVQVMQDKCNKYKAILHKSPKKTSLKRFLQKQFSYPTITEPEKPNLLHRGTLSGQKYLIFSGGKPQDNCFQKVKDIKNYYQVAFSDVIVTAISAALNEHFSQHSQIETKDVICMNPLFLMSSDFHKLVTIKENVPIVNLGNKFAMGFTKIPIHLPNCNNTGNGLRERLKIVERSNTRLKDALDFPFCYWQLRMFTGLPLIVGKHLLLANDATICISNVPGNITSKLTNGYTVTDTFVFANNYGDLGVTITLFTYNEQFRIGLLIDKSLISKRTEAQLLGDNIFKYINALETTIHEDNL